MSLEDSDSGSIFVTRLLLLVSSEFRQLIQRLDRKYDHLLNALGEEIKIQKNTRGAIR